MPRLYRHLGFLGFGVTLAVTGACASDPDCGEGRYRKGNGCYLWDAGRDADGGDGSALDASTSEAAASVADGAPSPASGDGSTGTLGDAQLADSNIGADSSTPLDANADSSGDSSVAISNDASADAAPPPECDAVRMCAPGLVCANAKCVSACMQTQCDPNATCSLVGTMPTCNCNRGYTASSGSGTTVVCARNLACDQLGCDAKATCEGTQEAGFQCRCISGYTGTGKSCTPVTCEAPPTVPNLSWPTAPVTFGNLIEGKCSDGYAPVAGLTLFCGADKKWVGTVPACKIKTCPQPEAPRFPDGTASGTVTTSEGIQYGAKARYGCKGSLSLSGPSERTCGADAQWTGKVPECLGCGDQVKQAGEACDPTAPGSNVWTCSASCTVTPTYNFPRCDNASCTDGMVCVGGQYCERLCDSASSCPIPPLGLLPLCAASRCRAKGCTNSSQCPSGLICLTDTGSGTQYCSLCSSDSDCSNGLHCRGLVPTDSIGKCQ